MIKSILAEIELLTTVPEAIKRLGFSNFTIKINDRRLLKEMVIASNISEEIFPTVCISLDKADKIGLDGVSKELALKGLTDEQITALLNRMDTKLENLDSEASKELNSIINIVSKYYPIEFDPTLVRGMGYYTGAIFEVESNEFKGALGGGGRYDNLLNKYQNDPIPAVGFSIGFERIVDLLKTKEMKLENKEKIALVYIDENLLDKTVSISQELGGQGKITSMFKVNKNKNWKENKTIRIRRIY